MMLRSARVFFTPPFPMLKESGVKNTPDSTAQKGICYNIFEYLTKESA